MGPSMAITQTKKFCLVKRYERDINYLGIKPYLFKRQSRTHNPPSCIFRSNTTGTKQNSRIDYGADKDDDYGG